MNYELPVATLSKRKDLRFRKKWQAASLDERGLLGNTAKHLLFASNYVLTGGCFDVIPLDALPFDVIDEDDGARYPEPAMLGNVLLSIHANIHRGT